MASLEHECLFKRVTSTYCYVGGIYRVTRAGKPKYGYAPVTYYILEIFYSMG